MKINIISVGKLSKEYSLILNHYTKMIKWKLLEKEISYSKKLPENQIKSYEAKLILDQINKDSFKIALDVKGKTISSNDFSLLFKKQMMLSRDIDIIIGGAFGFDECIIQKANIIISLSNMTFPHQLAKIILIEQIYRAQTIVDGHPYHK